MRSISLLLAMALIGCQKSHSNKQPMTAEAFIPVKNSAALEGQVLALDQATPLVVVTELGKLQYRYQINITRMFQQLDRDLSISCENDLCRIQRK